VTASDAPVPPPAVAELAPGWTAELAYRLVPHLTTWRLSGPDGAIRYAKVDTEGGYPTLRHERDRMVWAIAYLPVPRVVAFEVFGSTSVLITEALPGRDATDPTGRGDVAALVRALGRGLRQFHEAVGEEWCPFRFELERAVHHVAQRIESDHIDPAGFHDIHAHLTPAAAFDQLCAEPPLVEELVVCHGDYCAPNVLLRDGRVSGYVDLGELGVADRWWDIAVGAWSVGWNFGAGYESDFYEGYGIAPDPERIAYYRLLYDLVS
jgi:kanamycin kinase